MIEQVASWFGGRAENMPPLHLHFLLLVRYA